MRTRLKAVSVMVFAVSTLGVVAPAAHAGPIDDAVRVVQNLPVDGALKTTGDLIRYATSDGVTKAVVHAGTCVVNTAIGRYCY